MRFLATFAIFLFACETTIEKCHCSVAASDALPIQFWPLELESYNTKEKCGVHDVCFCQEFHCDDEIVIQFDDDSGDDHVLQFLDEDGELLYQEDFSQDGDIYTASVIPSDISPDICDSDVVLYISKWASIISDLNGSTDGWSNAGESFNTWDFPISFSVNFVSSPDDSDIANKDIDIQQGQNIRMTFSFGASTAGMDPISMDISVEFKNGGSIIHSFSYNTTTEDIIEEIEFFVASSDIDQISIHTENVGTETNTTMQIYTVKVDYSAPSYRSDCVKIRSSGKCSTLIEYSNNRNFAGLFYEQQSPDAVFYARVPAIFFEEREVEEDESMELPNSVLTLNSQTKTQRLLTTANMPHYMHRKLLLILQHQSVIIDGRQWVKEAPYEKQEGDRRWPLRKAQCWLTDKGSVQRNVL